MAGAAYHHGNLRSDLLDLALARVRQGGPSALVVRDLARAAGVTPAALYRPFPSADHLRAAVSLLCRQRLAEAMLRARDGTPPGPDAALRRFEAIGRAYVRFAIEEPGWFAAAFLHCPVETAAVEDPSAWGVLQGALDELVAAGAMDPRRRPSAAMVAWSGVHGLGMLLSSGAIPTEGGPFATALDDVIEGIQRALGVDPAGPDEVGVAELGAVEVGLDGREQA